MTIDKRVVHISLPCVGDEEWEATREVYRSGWITQGPKVAEFEKEFAKLHNAKHALAVTSCTTGLHLCLAGLDIQAGDEVIVPAFTWVATANVVEYMGAKPVFCDVDTRTNNIDTTKLKSLITNKTKAIIPVHLFGLCADIDEIKAIATDIPIIEDAACAAASQYKDGFAGTLGLAGVFSLHPRKSISTGEGGMILTNDDAFADKLGKLRNHGAEISEEQRHHGAKPYLLPDFNMLGYNYRMTDIQGAVGLVQIKKLMGFVEERDKWAKYYNEKLSEISWLTTPLIPENGRHSWQSYCVYVDPDTAPMKRNDIMMYLKDHGIAARPGTHAVHMLNYYQDKYGYKASDFPGAQACNDNTMSIPLHNRMSVEDFEYVVEKLKAL